jgi:hypothetical protein
MNISFIDVEGVLKKIAIAGYTNSTSIASINSELDYTIYIIVSDFYNNI